MDNRNKLLPIFYNYKETADALPKKYRGQFWELVINYAFDGENAVKSELEVCNKYVKIAFFSVKNLLKLNKKAGSQNGISNNISGLKKVSEPNIGANIGANITPIPYIKENNINKKENKEIYNHYGELKNVWLTQEDYDKLSKEHPNLNLAIEKLDGWLETKNGSKEKHRNHRHYFKSNGWVWENLKETKQPSQDGWRGAFGNAIPTHLLDGDL